MNNAQPKPASRGQDQYRPVPGQGAVRADRELKPVERRPPQTPALGVRQRTAEPADGLRYRHLAIDRREINEAERTIPVSFSSETREVAAYDWDLGEVPEILSHAEGACELGPLLNVGSVLLNHDSRMPVAVPREAMIDATGKRGRAVIHFPKGDPDADRAWLKITAGLLRGVSVGWAPMAVEKVSAGKRSSQGHEGPCIVVTRWAVHEISLTPVPADSTVGVGRAKKAPTQEESAQMEPKLIRTMVRAAGLPENFAEKLIARKLPDEEAVQDAITAERARSVVPPAPARPAAGRETAAEEEDDDDEEDAEEEDAPRSKAAKLAARQARIAERERISEIHAAVRTAKLPQSVADELVENGTSLDKARKIILDKMAEGDGQAISAGRGGNARDVQASVGEEQHEKHFRYLAVNLGRAAHATIARAKGMENAGGFEEDETTKKVERAHVGLQAFVREVLALRGVPNARFMEPAQLWSTALHPETKLRAMRAGGAANTSVDLANALSNLQNKSLMRGFNIAKPTWRSWCRKGSLTDFKIAPNVQLTDMAQMRETGENGEILDSKLSDRAENRQLALYARKVSLTLQMFINDDLDALGRLPALMGKSAAQLPSRLVYLHLLSNPTMSDGVALFHSSHGNLSTGGGSALGASGLAQSMQKFRKQTAPQAPNDSEFAAEPIDIEGRILLVPPELEYTGYQLVNPNLFVAETQMFKNKFTLEIESRLSNTGYTGYSATAWYQAAAAEDADTMEVSFLNGNEAPVTGSWEEFERLAVQFRAWLACGAKALDWRGIQKNAGA